MRIGTQLKLGLGAIVALVVALVFVAWLQSTLLFQQTRDMYEHPMQVRMAVGRLESDVLAIHRDMRGLFLTDKDADVATIQQAMAAAEADAARRLDVLRARYLGPQADVERTAADLARWAAIRAETVRLLRAGSRSQAAARTMPGGVGSQQALVVLSDVRRISDYAAGRAERFYADAERRHHQLQTAFAITGIVVVVLAVVISWRLIRRIQRPLDELAAATTRFGGGDLEARSSYTSRDEFGELASAFNTMAADVQERTQIDRQVASLVEVMASEDEVHAFCRGLLEALAEQTGSQVGAVYFLSADGTTYEHFESLGLGAAARASFSAAEREGEFGAALATQRIQRLTDVPDDTRLLHSAVVGDFVPREIVTVPVVSGAQVVALVSLASVRGYSPAQLKLLDEVWGVLSARVNGVLAYLQIQEFASRLEVQNRELESQKRELAAQGDELTEQNIELEMQKRELGEANRLKSAFLSNMSHELRTPLNSVIALSGVLNRRLIGVIGDEEYGYLEVIERNGRHLLALINDILDLSRIEAGREDVSVSRFSLRDLIAEVVEMLAPQAREKDVGLSQTTDPELPALVSDVEKCRHILQNLVGNAVKFTDRGVVEIAARQQGDEVVVDVIDTGIGIAPDQLEEIFDEFRQADDGTSRKYGGTGLGLAIARRYATLLGGSIGVRSALGEGSTFTLRLPLECETPHLEHPPEYRSLPDGQPPAGDGRLVLLVEDSEPAIVQITDVLTTAGYRVQVAHDGREALDCVSETLPDAVVLDLMMPEVDGFEVLRAVRSQERTARLPVLILTAKHVSREELSFLEGNDIHQLVRKGDITGSGLLTVVGQMLAPPAGDMVEEPAATELDGPAAGRAGPVVVLVVDDDADSRRAARALLGDGFVVIEAGDGREGLERLRSEVPDVVLMDVAMPVLDGVTALRAIRADESLRSTPVIAVTASAMTGDREAILAHGFDDYVSKPVDAGTLMAALKGVLGG